MERVKNPTFGGFLQDNLLRLLLNPFDRLVAAYQAYPSLKARFYKPGTFSHTFTEIMNEGVFLGAFKGVIFNFAQLGFVLYPSVYFANKNGGDNKFLSFITSYTLFDALFYPVDTLKNILYADTLGTYNVKTVANRIGLPNLYRGISLKLIYNLPVLSGIYNTTQVGNEYLALACWAVALLLYPLNTQKVRAQVSGSALSTINSKTSPIEGGSYRGAVLYLLLNAFIGYSLRPLFSEDKLAQIEDGVKSELRHQGYA